MSKTQGMTDKQRRFAEAVLDGMTFADAYRHAYPVSLKWSQDMLSVEASRSAAHPKIRAYVQARQAELRAAAQLNREDLLTALGKIVKRVGKDANAQATAVVAATAQASRMLGCDAPTKIEMKVEGSLLYRIRKNSAR